MAGDWIPIRIGLHEDPAVLAMATQLRTREEHIVGYLVRIWGWVNENCYGGSVTNVSLESLGRVCGLPGFPEMMRDVGWLIESHDSDGRPVLIIPNHDRWLSKSAKDRAMTRLRMKKLRDEEKKKRGKSDANVTEPLRICDARTVTKSALQNRIEEKSNKKEEDAHRSPKTGETTRDSYPDWFEEFWSAYPHRKGRPTGKRETFTAAKRVPADCRGRLVTAAKNYALDSQVQEGYGKDPVRFIRNGLWEDFVELSEALTISQRASTPRNLKGETMAEFLARRDREREEEAARNGAGTLSVAMERSDATFIARSERDVL
jgi:hypothetical protein